MTRFSCELYGKFQSRHIITLCHSMIPIACQRVITSAHHNAAIWLFPTSAIRTCSESLCASYGLSPDWQRLSVNRTHMFDTQKTFMLSSFHFSSEAQTFHRLQPTAPQNHFKTPSCFHSPDHVACSSIHHHQVLQIQDRNADHLEDYSRVGSSVLFRLNAQSSQQANRNANMLIQSSLFTMFISFVPRVSKYAVHCKREGNVFFPGPTLIISHQGDQY